MQRKLWCLVVVALVVGGSGCRESAELPDAVEQAAITADHEPDADGVDVEILDYAGIQMLIESHRGKVVVMDAWSTSCPPCVKEFPNLVALHQKYGPDRLACISLSFDHDGLKEVREVKEPVLAFLQHQKATFDNVLSSVESDELYRLMDLASVPAVFVYDAEGTLRKRFDDSDGEGFTYADVEPLIVELLAEQASQ